MMYNKGAIVQRILFLTLLFGVSFGFTINAQDKAMLIEANHKVFVPQGDGPFPVIIAMPGCSGVSLNGPETDAGRPGMEDDVLFRKHYPYMAKKLQNEGYLVFLMDYLSAENVINTCGGEIPHERVAEYVNAAIGYIKTLPEADVSRIHIVGWSYGGVGVLKWLSNLETDPIGVQSVITIYPGCGGYYSWKSSIPVLMLLGEADDIAPYKQCIDLVNSLPEQTNVKIKTYPNARHGFDMPEGPELLPIGHGMTVGRNEQAGKDAWQEMLSFLGKHN